MPKRQRKNAMRDGNCPFRLMDRTMTLNRSHFTQQVPPGNRTIRSRQSVTLSNEKLAILRFSHDSMDNELAFPRTQRNIAPSNVFKRAGLDTQNVTRPKAWKHAQTQRS